MIDVYFEGMLKILKDSLEENDFKEDNDKVKYLYNSLSKYREELPSKEELDKIEDTENYLEFKYDAFIDLSYYFGPIYVDIERRIHDNWVKKLREENRRKRN